MVVASIAEVCVVVVLAIVLHDTPPFVEFSQRITFPVFPLKVNKLEVFPSHMVLPPVTDPGTVCASTVTMDGLEVVAVQPLPSVTVTV